MNKPTAGGDKDAA